MYISLYNFFQPRIHQLCKFGIVDASHKKIELECYGRKIKLIFRIVNDNNNSRSNVKRLDLEKSD